MFKVLLNTTTVVSSALKLSKGSECLKMSCITQEGDAVPRPITEGHTLKYHLLQLILFIYLFFSAIERLQFYVFMLTWKEICIETPFPPLPYHHSHQIFVPPTGICGGLRIVRADPRYPFIHFSVICTE